MPGLCLLFGGLCAWAGPAMAGFGALGTALDLPDWLTVQGEARQRYETLGGQFRAGGTGGDQLLALRTLIHAEARTHRVTFGLELADMRTYLDDAGTPLSTSFVNAADVLQAYVKINLSDPGTDRSASLQVGRYTLDVGSRKLQQRNGFRNTINALTGAHFIWADGAGTEFVAFYGMPVIRRPSDRTSLDDNDAVFDRERGNQHYGGIWWKTESALPGWHLEAYVYGLSESDAANVFTRNRQLATPGLRLRKPPASGSWDAEVEAAWQAGTARASSSASDTRDLSVSAQYVFGALGYTFDHPWAPRLALEYSFASGDADPADGRLGRFDTLFGARRTEFGNTSINGPLQRSNIHAPGIRVSFTGARTDGRLFVKPALLASGRDVWLQAGVRDPSGQSGFWLGTLLDGRLRHWLVPDILRGEIGGSVFFDGPFARAAPNASGEGDTVFGYLQFTAYF